MLNENYYGTKYNYVYINAFAMDMAKKFKVRCTNYFKSLLHAALYDTAKICFNPSEFNSFVKNGRYNEKFLNYIKEHSMDLLRNNLNKHYKENPKMEELKESKGKRIIITDKQAKKLNEDIKINVKSKHPVDPEKVKAIAKYMDSSFKRARMNTIGDNGYPVSIPIVGMIGCDGNIVKNMTDEQLFYLLQDRFHKLYSDTGIRDRLLKQIIKDWYPKKISKEGLLSVNLI